MGSAAGRGQGVFIRILQAQGLHARDDGRGKFKVRGFQVVIETAALGASERITRTSASVLFASSATGELSLQQALGY